MRFLGHAGSDAEVAYRTPAEIVADYARDPLIATARLLAAAGVADGAELVERYEQVRERARTVAIEAMAEPQLASAEQVIGAAGAAAGRTRRRRRPPHRRSRPLGYAVFGSKLPEHEGPLTLAQSINRALHDELARRPQALVFGEDVSVKGGVYGLTRGLRKAFGAGRVFDTILDEQAILGVGLGAALAGFLPIPEIQYLAYLHNAEDQLRGEAATLQFFSQGQYRNPMVVRIAGLGYQKGFGGHFHNDNSVAVLRDIPGLVLAVPAHPSDAPAMLRTLLAAAGHRRHRRRLPGADCPVPPTGSARAGDGGWLAAYAAPADWAAGHVPIGRRPQLAGRPGRPALTILTFGNGLPMSLRVAQQLAGEGVGSTVVRPALAEPAAGRGHPAGGSGHRPGADRGRDPALRRGVGGGDRRAGRWRVRRQIAPGDQRRQLHPARRCGPGGAARRADRAAGGPASCSPTEPGARAVRAPGCSGVLRR